MIKNKLYDLIWEHRTTGKKVSEATKITPATISKMVRGECSDVKLSTINKLCNYFKCEIKDILEYIPD